MLMTFRLARRIRRDQRGLALLEFALSLPLVLGISLYGIELANLALMHMRVSQAALNLADNASRIDIDNALTNQHLREADINDILGGVRTYGAAWDLTTRGRITLFSLEKKAGETQRIHWIRCIGKMATSAYEAHYDQAGGVLDIRDGTTTDTGDQGVTQDAGLGDNNKVSAPDGTGVMFVEINYDYKPVVGTGWLPGGAALIHYTASFLVRDRRDFSVIYNPAPAAAPSTCDLHNS